MICQIETFFCLADISHILLLPAISLSKAVIPNNLEVRYHVEYWFGGPTPFQEKTPKVSHLEKLRHTFLSIVLFRDVYFLYKILNLMKLKHFIDGRQRKYLISFASFSEESKTSYNQECIWWSWGSWCIFKVEWHFYLYILGFAFFWVLFSISNGIPSSRLYLLFAATHVEVYLWLLFSSSAPTTILYNVSTLLLLQWLDIECVFWPFQNHLFCFMISFYFKLVLHSSNFNVSTYFSKKISSKTPRFPNGYIRIFWGNAELLHARLIVS